MRSGGLILTALVLTASCMKTDADVFDPQANAWRQLEAASERARDSGRRVLVVIGGNW